MEGLLRYLIFFIIFIFMQTIPLDPDNLQSDGPRIPLHELDQKILEEMLFASTLENSGMLLELVDMHRSEEFDRDVVICLLEGKELHPQTKEVITKIRETSACTRKYFEEADALQREQLRDFHGLGSKKY